jgi:UTP--glucose-1-phosphate uridylyltransferase
LLPVLGDAVNYAKGFTSDEPFIVALGDAVIENKDGGDSLLKRMLKVYQEKQPAFVVAVREVAPDQVSKYGILDIQQQGSDGCYLINDLVEKPAVHEAPSNYAIAARYVFAPDLFQFLDRTLPGTGGEIQLTDAMNMMLKHDYQAYAVSLNEHEMRHDIGTFASYYQSFIHFALKDKEYGYRIKQYLQSIMDDEESEGRIL